MLFGNVIRLYNDEEIQEYVYLCASPDNIIFLARIPDINISQQILKRQDKLAVRPPTQNILRAQNSDLFFYVELTTVEFRNRVAMLTGTDYDDTELDKIREVLPSLEEKDLQNIKREILAANNNAVNPKLKRIIQDLEGDNNEMDKHTT